MTRLNGRASGKSEAPKPALGPVSDLFKFIEGKSGASWIGMLSLRSIDHPWAQQARADGTATIRPTTIT